MTKNKTSVWVLTREINEYDQDGQYYETVFFEKPTVKSLAEYFTGKRYQGDVMETISFLEHLLEGGGRQGTEHEWFYLEEVTSND